MRSPSRFAMSTLVLLGLMLAVGNVWFAAVRSTIPIGVDGVVTDKRLLTEKHPGIDDVYLLEFRTGGVLQVDRHVFEAMETGEHLSKEAWASRIAIGEREVHLDWSADLRGMIVAMTGGVVVLVLTALVVLSAQRQ